MQLSDAEVYNTEGYSYIVWYELGGDCGPGGEQVAPYTVVQDGDVYYAAQTVDNGCCPGVLQVTFHSVPPVPAPTGEQDQYFFEGYEYTLGQAQVYNTDAYDTIYWFTTPTQETGSEVGPDTPVSDGVTYYAFQEISYDMEDCQSVLYLAVTFHKILGVDERDALVRVYPNPVDDVLMFDFRQPLDAFDLSIYNTMGEKLLSFENLKSTQNALRIDVSRLVPGVYFLEIRQGAVRQRVKLNKK